MPNNFHQINQHEQEECISRGICSISPALSALHEVITLYLRDLAFYLLRLKEIGAKNSKIKEHFIDILSGMIVNVEYSPDQFQAIISLLYEEFAQAKTIYSELCQKNNLEERILKSHLKKINYSAAIREGQRQSKIKNSKYTKEQKYFLDEMLILIKSICIHLVELKGYGYDDEEVYYNLLELIQSTIIPEEDEFKQEEVIGKFVNTDFLLLKELDKSRQEKFGQITQVEVDFSIRPNKAILVVGNNLNDLNTLLEATAGKGIDVYTYGRMIMAHAYPKIKAHPHLVGHFGRGVDSGLVDLAAFPGAIFMTRLSLQRMDRLYRSRIFSTDVVVPKGVFTIKNGNLDPLIESALVAKGFLHSQQKGSMTVGFFENEVFSKVREIAEKMESGQIKHFFVIGVSNGTNTQQAYFERFLDLVPSDCFVFSFSYTNEAENVLHVPSDVGFPVLYRVIDILSKNTKISDLNLSVLLTRCEQHTISNLLNMKYMGIKDVYFSDCSPVLVNPSLVEDIREKYGIKKYTHPAADIQRMLADM